VFFVFSLPALLAGLPKNTSHFFIFHGTAVIIFLASAETLTSSRQAPGLESRARQQASTEVGMKPTGRLTSGAQLFFTRWTVFR
jgi:hypothetical protein